jgi:hypothetical protein
MNFYTIVIITAIIFLILLLTYIGIAMSKIPNTARFAPFINQCPDYWENDGSGYCIYPIRSGKNTGKFTGYIDLDTSANAYLTNPADPITSGLSSFTDPAKKAYVDVQQTQLKEKLDVSEGSWSQKYPDLSTICAKKKWAVTNGISWDGVTNSTVCV